MNFNYFLDTIKNRYADFSGRVRRKDFFTYFLFFYAINIAALIIDFIIKLVVDIPPILFIIASLVLLVPTLAITVRRLHDTSKSGWFMLIGLIPVVNLYLLYVLVLDGTPGANEYGPDPKEVSNI